MASVKDGTHNNQSRRGPQLRTLEVKPSKAHSLHLPCNLAEASGRPSAGRKSAQVLGGGGGTGDSGGVDSSRSLWPGNPHSHRVHIKKTAEAMLALEADSD